jgi:EpsI family protein
MSSDLNRFVVFCEARLFNMSNHTTIQSLNQSSNLYGSAFYKKLWIQVGIFAVIFLFSYYTVLASLIRAWSGRDDYSHGFLIPLISLYFVWHKRKGLRQIQIEPNITSGLILTVIGSLMLLTGHIGSVIMVQQISVLVVIPGIVLTLLGTNYLKALILPLSYLIFMIPPILDLVIGNIHWPFQLFSATIAAKILESMKIPVFQYAQYLELPNITLEVAKACSGIRYLISIIAMSIPLAFFTQAKNSLRLLFIGSAIIIGILINPLRIALIGIWTFYTGQDVHGPSHIFQGFFVSQVGFAFLFLLAWILSKIPANKPLKSQNNQNKIIDDLTVNTKQFNKAWIMVISLFIILGAFMLLYKPKVIPLKAPLNSIPLTLGGTWQGRDSDSPKTISNMEGADFELSRIYQNSTGGEIEIYIGYFEFQKQNKKFIHYTLQKLYDNSKEFTIPLSARNPIKVNRTLMHDSAHDSLILYWYDINGEIVADNYKAKLLTVFDGLIHRRTNGAIVMVSSNVTHADDFDKVLKDEVHFIQALFPFLSRSIP